MEVVDIKKAKTHLSRLVDRAARGESFVIAKAGRPRVMVVPFDALDLKKPRRFGFLSGAFKVPDDFDRMGQEQIVAMFGRAS